MYGADGGLHLSQVGNRWTSSEALNMQQLVHEQGQLTSLLQMSALLCP